MSSPTAAADRVDLVDDAGDAAGLDRLDAARLEAERDLRRIGMTVDADALPDLATEQVPDGRLERLALDVPERHVDAAQRPGADDPGHAVAHHRAEHLLPEPLDMGRVLADEKRAQILHGAFHHARPAAALADPGDAGIGVDLEEEPVPAAALAANAALRTGPVGRRIGILGRELRLHQEGPYSGDAHHGPRGRLLWVADVAPETAASEARTTVR
jgi:hypothetical protein